VPAGVGYLLFLQENTLTAQRFETDVLRLVGEAVPMVVHRTRHGIFRLKLEPADHVGGHE
jgi:hypothetical protein